MQEVSSLVHTAYPSPAISRSASGPDPIQDPFDFQVQPRMRAYAPARPPSRRDVAYYENKQLYEVRCIQSVHFKHGSTGVLSTCPLPPGLPTQCHKCCLSAFEHCAACRRCAFDCRFQHLKSAPCKLMPLALAQEQRKLENRLQDAQRRTMHEAMQATRMGDHATARRLRDKVPAACFLLQFHVSLAPHQCPVFTSLALDLQ